MTPVSNSKVTAILVMGDLIVYIFSLILTLAIRYAEIPSRQLLLTHLISFSILIVIFLVVNFSAGLYDKQLAVIKGRIHGSLLRVQIVNAVIGVVFFYFAPVSIAPKANLFIYFLVSTALLLIWRMIMFPVVRVTKKQVGVVLGEGHDIDDLCKEIDGHQSYGLLLKTHVIPGSLPNDTVDRIALAVKSTNASIIVADFHDSRVESAMSFLYSLIFSGIKIIDAGKLYESIYDRIPISMVGERWLVENSATALGNRRVYDVLKRLIDIMVSAVGGLVSLAFYPFVYMAIKLDDNGSIFISQNRIGKDGKAIKIFKFRSMSGNDSGQYGRNGTTKNYVTRVGKFLRVSRIDELPQFWNVLRGDLSMVGPRPELPYLGDIYEKEIPYYNARHLVKPGLFGWAQIYHEEHPHHSVATAETRDKLSYDLYYIKNRSLGLDIKIVLRTLQVLMKRVGR